MSAPASPPPTRRSFPPPWAVALGLLACLPGPSASAQVPEDAKDLFGVAIPVPHVHLVHGVDATREGTTAHLREHRPFLLFQLGRDLFNRAWRREHGAYGRAGMMDVPMYAGAAPSGKAAARFARDHAGSCGMCHSSVYREPSAGQTIASTGSLGRNTTHAYGAGLVELLGEQVRAALLGACDRDGDGLISRAEAARRCPARVRPEPGAPWVDYGTLAPGADGVPALNPVFRVWYVDAASRPVPDALGLNDPRVAAFGFAMQPFGWGRGRARVRGHEVSQGGEAATLREFFAAAADVHMGLQAHDPSQQAPGGVGLAGVSLNGARQFDFSAAPDLGRSTTATGVSLDDPDGDGRVSELTQGDLDAAEFYLLHAPAPATRGTAETERGRGVMERAGCTTCHVERWAFAQGDRRLFRLEVHARPGEDGVAWLEGQLVRTGRALPSGGSAPAGGGFALERVYSDFKHWDIGPGFHERRFDGSLQREHRTAPLWGVGSTAPYGHDGQYPTLDAAIRAHGGAAARAQRTYAALPEPERRLLLDYLESLVLYPTDRIPADVDGDGVAAPSMRVAGVDVGPERFDARWLFEVPLRPRRVGEVMGPDGQPLPLLELDGIPEAYGLRLPHRRDGDGDGFPDVVDPAPQARGLVP